MASVVQLDSLNSLVSVGFCGESIFRRSPELHSERSYVVQQRCQQSKFNQAGNRGLKQVTDVEGNSLGQLL